MPITQEDVKGLLKSKQDQDEAVVIKFLAEAEEAKSIASKIYRAWNLDRQVIKECHEAMAGSRSLQVTFNNIVGATRFKTFEGSQLRKAKCQQKGCGAVDSWEHFLVCYQVPDLGSCGRKTKVGLIIDICEKAEVNNPGRPKPSGERYMEEGLESGGEEAMKQLEKGIGHGETRQEKED